MKRTTYIIALTIFLGWQNLLVAQSTDKNFVKTSTVKKEAVTNPDSVNIGNAHQNVQYIDGIGRPNQVVQIQTSPGQKDLVQPIKYDDLGRETKTYLPYVNSNNTGNYVEGWETGLDGFYKNISSPVDTTSYPWAEKGWDNSPLNRVMKQGAPGADWQLNAHPVGFDYQTNLANEVPLLTWDVVNNTYADEGYYAAGKLYLTQTTDENGSITKEYKNFSGQVILKTSFLGNEQISTYYIYDDFNNLACVIPPKAYHKFIFNVPDINLDSIINSIPDENGNNSGLKYGLVSYYKLDGTSGDVIDEMGTNNGTSVGVTRGVAGKYANAFQFNGYSGYVSLGNGKSFTTELMEGFTFSAWIKTSASTGRIIDNDYGYNAMSYYFETSNGKLRLIVHTAAGDKILTGNTLVNNNQWRHVAAKYYGDKLYLYVDGVLDNYMIMTDFPVFYQNNVMIGRLGQYNANNFNGLIDEIGIWNRPLTVDEIRRLSSKSIDEAVSTPAYILTDDLVSYYKLNDLTGTVIDEIGNNNGTCIGAIRGVGGVTGSAFDFDGSDDKVNLGNSSSITTGLVNGFTMSAWIKGSDYDGRIISNENPNFGYYFGIYSYKICIRFNTSAGEDQIVGTTNLNDNQWHHVVTKYDGNTIYLYVDGALQNSKSISYPLVISANYVCMGGRYGSTGYSYDGLIDEVGIWSRALAYYEIINIYNKELENYYPTISTLSNGLVSYYKMDDISGSVIDDLGLNNGTVSGASRNQTGKINKAFDFDGYNDYISLGNPTSITEDLEDAFTFSAWIKTSSFASGRIISNEKNNSNFYFGGSSNKLTISVKTLIDQKTLVGNTVLNNNVWHHVVAKFDGSYLYLYVDGVLDNSMSIGYYGLGFYSYGINIGANMEYSSSIYNPFDGLIDEVGIWNRALTAAEITELYNTNVGLAYPFVADSVTEPSPEHDPVPEIHSILDSLVSYYKFNETSGTVIDETANNYATNVGATAAVEGKIGNCYNFDGSNDYISLGNSSSITTDLINGFTLSTWMKSSDIEGRVIGNTDNNFSYCIESYVYNARVKINTTTGIKTLTGNTNNMHNNQWHHVLAKYDGYHLYLYIDGTLNASMYIADPLVFYANDVKIGLQATYTNALSGKIDEVGIWNRALSTKEIKELYNNAIGKTYPFQEFSPELIVFPEDLVYTYKYDHRNRVIEKNIPGQKEVYMVYDRLDRLVLTQDAKMREENKWLFTKYDAFSRPVETGIYQNRTDTSQGDMQILVNTELDLFETFNTSTKTYSCVAFPVADSITEYLTYNYYDNYTFIPTTKTYLDYTVDTDFGDNGVLLPKGLLTGSKVKVLGTSDEYLYTSYHYDNKDRLVRTVSDHKMGSYDIKNFGYDFIGNPLATKLVHNAVVNSITTSTTMKWWYHYDHAGRLLDVKHRVNSQPEQYIVQNKYNDLGQLLEKNLHATSSDPNGAYRQSIDYAYNIRGWLKSINNAGLTEPDNDLFGMELLYNEGFSELSGTNMFNGNISGIKWKVKDGVQRGYGFKYDSINRIKAARYAEKATSTFTQRPDDYTVSNINYDLNGNIKTLRRQGENTGTTTFAYGYIDQLAYSYIGNTLIAVNDTIADFATNNFKDGTSNGVLEYAYDVNGNMVRDDNKGIINIVYNYLNLPEEINFGNNKKIVYIYDANGNKLKKQVINGTTNTKTYTPSFVYNENILEYALFDEGRLLKDANGIYEYQYFLKDHLGNTRVTFSGNTGLIQQQDHYYPFGMNFSGIANAQAANIANQYKYNGKELQADLIDGKQLNWYDYGARFYDPTIARWNVIDPMAESYLEYSPYNYTLNNPINYTDPNGMWVETDGGYTTTDLKEITSFLLNLFGIGPGNQPKDEEQAQEQSQARNALSKVGDDVESLYETMQEGISWLPGGFALNKMMDNHTGIESNDNFGADLGFEAIGFFLPGIKLTKGPLKSVVKLSDNVIEFIQGKGELAKKVSAYLPEGFSRVNGLSKGVDIFTNGKVFISPDRDSHIGGMWKAAKKIEHLGSKTNRLGTYNEDFIKIGK